MNPFRRLFCKRNLNATLADEIRGHIEEKARALMNEGKSEPEAWHEARRAFGNVTLAEEASREAWGWSALEDVSKDLGYAIRILRNAPAFSVTAILVLALGIGMNTAIFSAVKAVLLSQLPYPEPDRLMALNQVARDGHLMNASGPDAHDWHTQNQTFASMATFGLDSVAISGSFAPRAAKIGIISKDFLQTMDVHPVVGREFSAEEQKPGGRPAALVSYSLASSLFGNAPNAANKTLRMNGLLFTVIGILPPGFDFPQKSELWISEEAFAENNERSAHNYRVIGRLKPDVPRRQAQADMDVIAARLARAYANDKDEGIRVTSLYDTLVGPSRPAFLVLLSAVACVLLIACVNISNLQLARAAVRVREMALRTALGAARARLIRQLLTESVLLSLAGGAAGLALAFAGCALLRHYAPPQIPRIENIHIDAEVLLFTTALSLAAGIAFGLLPALTASKADVNEALKEGSGKASVAPALKTWGNILVVGEVGMAVILLAGAALLLKSLWKLDHVDTGLRSDGVFAATLTWPINQDGDSVNGPEVARISRQILEQVRALPGVAAAGLITSLPIENTGADGSFEISGIPLPADPHDSPDAWYRAATAGYFKAFGLPILAGRNFTDADDHSPNQVALVNENFARTFFRNRSPLGQRIRFFGMERKPQFLTIIAIVPDIRAFGLKTPPKPEVFVDYLQHTASSLDITLVVQGPASTQTTIKKIVSGLNSQTPIDFESMSAVLSASLSREHFQTALLSLFAAVALALAALGIYGVLSYTVTRRTAEIGIRMALGARRSDVLTLVLREGVSLAAIGLALGLLGALIATRALTSLLYGVTPADPAVFAAIVLIFGSTALLGCFLPARRAAAIHPNVALRYE
jgi:putative ABC transport system permease protein